MKTFGSMECKEEKKMLKTERVATDFGSKMILNLENNTFKEMPYSLLSKLILRANVMGLKGKKLAGFNIVLEEQIGDETFHDIELKYYGTVPADPVKESMECKEEKKMSKRIYEEGIVRISKEMELVNPNRYRRKKRTKAKAF